MGLLMMAAVIERSDYDVEVKNYSSATKKEAIADLPEARVYGITITSMEIPYALEFARAIKKKYRKAKVIVGGPGTVTPELLIFDRTPIDLIVQGEADYEVLNILQNAQMFRGGIYPCTPPENLDELPYPARYMIRGKMGGDVFAYGKRYHGDESTVILSSRGCPFNCAFCAAPMLTSTVRYRSVESVAGEMRHVIDEYNIMQFRFSDDLFTVPRERAIKMCEAIGPLDVAWRVSARVKPLDKELLKIMKDAGCKELSFGIESFDDDVLRLLNKRATVNDNIRALNFAEDVGIGARILLMVGTPGQTPETIRLNKMYVEALPHTIVACTSFVPIPGSDVWYNPDKYGVEILSRDMKDYNFYFFGPDGVNDLKPVIKLKDRPLKEFIEESKGFRQWLFERKDVNRG